MTTESVTPESGAETGDDAALSLLQQKFGADEPEEELEDDVDEESEEGDGDEAEEGEEEAEDKPEPTGETFELKVNGETKKVTREEVIRLAQQGEDYTKKTMDVAEVRKQADTVVRDFTQKLGELLPILDAQLDPYKDVDWPAAYEQDPIEAAKHEAAYRRGKEQRDAAYREHEQLTEQQLQQARMAAVDEFARLEPMYGDPKQADAAWGKFANYLVECGYKPNEIKRLADSRTMQIAEKARKYDALQKSKPDAVKAVKSAPKFQAPGTARDPNPERSRGREGELRKIRSEGGNEKALQAFLIKNIIK